MRKRILAVILTMLTTSYCFSPVPAEEMDLVPDAYDISIDQGEVPGTAELIDPEAGFFNEEEGSYETEPFIDDTNILIEEEFQLTEEPLGGDELLSDGYAEDGIADDPLYEEPAPADITDGSTDSISEDTPAKTGEIIEENTAALEQNTDDPEPEKDITEHISGDSLAETIYPEEDDIVAEDLFFDYLEEVSSVGTGTGRIRRSAGRHLSGLNKTIYNILLEKISKVAAGEEPLTEFEIPIEELGFAGVTYYAENLGMASLVDGEYFAEGVDEALRRKVNYNMSEVINALILDCPYRLYWYDKTVGTQSMGYSYYAEYDYARDEYYVGLEGSVSVGFSVADEYSAGHMQVDTRIGSSVQNIISKASAIVSRYSGVSDSNKLKAYKDEVCRLASYNDDAAGGGYSYGNPWQLIWVFDEDASTSVVCEGYSKAFQYLCNLTDFEYDIDCICVTGTMAGGTGAGSHMWNIVTMENGKNYLVDVTNCDEGCVGHSDLLFLKGYESGDITSGYIYNCKGHAVSYKYRDTMFSSFSTDELNLSADSYIPGGRARIDGVLYDISSGSSAVVIGYEEGSEEYAVQKIAAGLPVTAIADSAFKNCSALTDITIPVSVTYIGANSFADCGNLKIVRLSKSLSSVDASAFDGDSLTAIFYPGTRASWEKVSIRKKGTNYSPSSMAGLFDSTPVYFGVEEIPKAVLSEADIELEKGSTRRITVSGLVRGDAVDTWKSGNTGVAAISGDGTITAVNSGSTTVTVTMTSGYTASVKVKVLADNEICRKEGHAVVIDKAVEASCTETGLTEGSHCSRCMEVIKAQEVIPAKGHTEVKDKAVEPTCIHTGLTEGSHCSVCSKVLRAQNTVAKLKPTITLSKISVALPDGGAETIIVSNLGPEDKVVSWSSDDPGVASVTNNGTISAVSAGQTNVTVTLLSGLTSTVSVKIVKKQVLFRDVADPSLFYFDAVYWAADNGIVGGWESDNTFRPMNDCNRAAVVTFLWRLAGRPEPASMATFKDMTGNRDFDKAISWASEQGITTGWEDNTFRPWNTCNRAAIVAFLWRFAGKPEVSEMASFKDMTGNSDFDKAISWASAKGIVTGWDDNTFRPWNNCKRLAVVSFLYRYKD